MIRQVKNMRNFKIDYLIKFGGSLLKNPDACKELVDVLVSNMDKNRFLIFPGGGDIDNYIEDYSITKRFLSRETFHMATLLAMDQTALLLSNYSVDLTTIAGFYQIKKAFYNKKIPILMPSQLIKLLDPTMYSNKISSDSLALYCSFLIEPKKIILLKSTDGIYNKKINQPIRETSFEKLLSIEQDCVDQTFPQLLRCLKIETYILNGMKTEDLSQLIKQGGIEHGTKIS